MTNVTPPPTFPRYLPERLVQRLEGPALPAGLFISRPGEATPALLKERQGLCTICSTEKSHEQPEDYPIPDTIGTGFEDSNKMSFKAHTIFVKLDCCGNIFHQHCVVKWLRPELIEGRDTTLQRNQTCPFCRALLYDSDEDLVYIDDLRNTICRIGTRGWSFYNDFRPLDNVDGDVLISCLRLVCYTHLVRADVWAADRLGHDIEAAMELECRVLGNSFHGTARDMARRLCDAAGPIIVPEMERELGKQAEYPDDAPQSLNDFVSLFMYNTSVLYANYMDGYRTEVIPREMA